MDISMRVFDDRVQTIFNMPSCIGEIQIGSFLETFAMPLEWWTLDDYKRQWREGLERIKTHDVSCLVAAIQDPTIAPWVNFWPLFKEGDKIYVQNRLLHGSLLAKELKKRGPFTHETCYNFIAPRRAISDDGTKISQWSVTLAT